MRYPKLDYGTAGRTGSLLFRWGLSLALVPIVTPTLLVVLRLYWVHLPERVVWVIVVANALAMVIGPVAAFLAIVVGGIGVRRYGHGRHFWVQALGLVSLIVSCAGGIYTAHLLGALG